MTKEQLTKQGAPRKRAPGAGRKPGPTGAPTKNRQTIRVYESDMQAIDSAGETLQTFVDAALAYGVKKIVKKTK